MSGYRAVVGVNIGHSSRDASTRRIGRKIPQLGFVEWHKRHYTPLLELGFTKFHRHNPGGAQANGPMEFDQFLHLDALDLPGVNGAAWVEGTRWLHGQAKSPGEAIQTCDYLGAIGETPAVRALVADPPRWRDYVGRCLEPCLQAGSAVGFDAVAILPASHPAMDLRERLESAGVPTFGEGWPTRRNPRNHPLGVVCTHANWVNAHTHPRAVAQPDGWAAADPQVTGPVRVLCGGDRDAIGQVLEAGGTPVIGDALAKWYADEVGI